MYKTLQLFILIIIAISLFQSTASSPVTTLAQNPGTCIIDETTCLCSSEQIANGDSVTCPGTYEIAGTPCQVTRSCTAVDATCDEDCPNITASFPYVDCPNGQTCTGNSGECGSCETP